MAVVGRRGDDPFVAYDAADPVLALYRRFEPDGSYYPEDAEIVAACSAEKTCTDYWGVEVKPL